VTFAAGSRFFAKELAIWDPWDLYRKVVGVGPEDVIFASRDSKWPHDWFKDGKSVLFADGKNFYRLLLEGDRKSTKLLASQFNNDVPRVSPDEHLAFLPVRRIGPMADLS